MQVTLNLNIEQIRCEVSYPSRHDLYCLYIKLKACYGDGAIHNLSITKIQKLMAVGHKKAVGLYKLAKSSPLFFYDKENNRLRTVTYKSKIDKYSAKGKVYRSDIVFKAKREDIRKMRLCDLRKFVRKVLVLNVLKMEEKNCLVVKHPQGEICSAFPVALGKIADKLNVSKSTACVLINEMQKEGWIKKYDNDVTFLGHATTSNYEYIKKYLGIEPKLAKSVGMFFIATVCSFAMTYSSHQIVHKIQHYRSDSASYLAKHETTTSQERCAKMDCESIAPFFSSLPEFNYGQPCML